MTQTSARWEHSDIQKDAHPEGMVLRFQREPPLVAVHRRLHGEEPHTRELLLLALLLFTLPLLFTLRQFVTEVGSGEPSHQYTAEPSPLKVLRIRLLLSVKQEKVMLSASGSTSFLYGTAVAPSA